MNKLLTLMVLGSMTSLSAEYYGNSYAGGSCPNCPGGGGYYQDGSQGGYNQGGYNQGNQGSNQAPVQAYYQDGSAPRLVGTRDGRVNDQNRNDQMSVNRNDQYKNDQNRNDTMMMNRTANTTNNTANTANNTVTSDDLNKKVRDALSGGWFSSGYKNVTFEINNGNVTLRGNVETAENKKNAEDAVRKVEGVRTVNNQINVTGTRETSETKNNVNNKYAQDSAATEEDRQLNAKIRDNIKGGWFSREYDTLVLRTSNGIVVISGVVDNQDDAQKINDRVKKVEGVRSVSNQLDVKNTK